MRLKNKTVKSLSHLAKNSQKIQANTWLLVFVPKPSTHHFLVILLLFPINIVKKCLEQKYRTQNKKTCQKWNPTKDNYIFHPNLLHKIFGHFVVVSIDTAQKYNGKKFRSFDTKTRESYKPTHDDLFLHPNHLHIIFCHFIVVSHQYG